MLMTLLLCACQEKTTSKADKMPNPKDFAYLHLVGTIGKDAVRMNLRQDLDYDGNPWYNGYYTNNTAQEPIGFFSSVDSSGQGLLILTELSLPNYPYGVFEGKFLNGVYSGEYTNTVGDVLPFSLKVDYPEGTLAFGAKRLERREAADEKRKNSPQAHFAYEYLIPEDKWLAKALMEEMVGDSLAAVYGTPEKAFEAEQAQYFKDYRSEAKEMMSEEEIPAFLNYDREISTEVLFNQDNLLSIATQTYVYSGGAHGNYGSSCATFDLAKKKKVKLGDVFKPGHKKALTKILTQTAKNRYQVENLQEVFFEKEVEPNENFFLTGKGICFNYVPYEIAAYAMGEVKIFVPFTELKTILK